MKKIILFGNGRIGKAVLEFLGSENIAFFVDNNLEKDAEKKNGIADTISFTRYKKIYDSYFTVVSTNEKNAVDIERQLLDEGVENYIVWKEIIDILNGKNRDYKKIFPEKSVEVIDYVLKIIKEKNKLVQSKNSDIEFYLVDSFEIGHFFPIYCKLKGTGFKTEFVVEHPAINSAGDWFDYQNACHKLREMGIDFCTFKNPKSKVAFTTQFAENVEYYEGLKCQISYGVGVLKEKEFRLKKEVATKFDYIFVHGDWQKRILNQWLSSDRIIDMSYPRYLNCYNVQEEGRRKREEILKELNVFTEKPIVTYYPTWDEYSSTLEYELYLKSLQEKFFVISKPHHCMWRFQDKMDALHRCSNLVLDGKYDLYKAAIITECAICDAKSGVITELVFLNPDIHMVILYYNASKEDFYINLDEFSRCVESPGRLKYTVEQVVKKDEKLPFRKDMIHQFYSADIKAGIERMVKKMYDII